MGNLKLSRTAIRELTRLYRGVLMAAFVAGMFVATGARAADISTADGLKTALQTGGSNTVTADISGISGVTSINGKTNTLDLNEKTLSGEGTSGFSFSGGSVTLTNGGTISGFSNPDANPANVDGNEFGILDVRSGSALNIEDGDWTFSGNHGGLGAVNSLNASAIIDTNGKVVFENNISDTQGGGFRHDISDHSYDEKVARITADEIKFKGNTIESTIGAGAGAMNSRGTVELLGNKNTFEGNSVTGTPYKGYKRGGGAVANQSGANANDTIIFDATMVIGHFPAIMVVWGL